MESGENQGTRLSKRRGGGGEEGVGEAWVRREPLGGLAVVSRPC